MTWVAVAIAGSAVVGAAASSRASSRAARAAERSGDAAIAEQREAREAFEQRTEPFRQIGLAAAPSILQLLGIQVPEGLISGDFSGQTGVSQQSQFDPQLNQQILDLEAELADIQSRPRLTGPGGAVTMAREQTRADQITGELAGLRAQAAEQALQQQGAAQGPAAQSASQLAQLSDQPDTLLSQVNPLVSFLRDEGFEDIQESAAAQGRLRSGGTLEDLTRFNTNLASTVVPQLQQQRFNQLFNLLGLGQNAAVGQGSAALSTASNIGNLMQGIGQAQGQAAIAQGQAINQGISDLAGTYGLYRSGYFNPQSQGLVNTGSQVDFATGAVSSPVPGGTSF